jgi:hypothetical protein
MTEIIVFDLKRKIFTDKSTIGQVTLEDKPICYVLEDKDRGLDASMGLDEITKLKVYGETCIPYGTYEVVITYSQRFKKDLPLLLNVPGYMGIRIHAGNTPEHSHGCLLPGSSITLDYVSGSMIAFSKWFGLIQDALLSNKKVFIKITK